MGIKLNWTGLTFIIVANIFDWKSGFIIAGAAIMVLGCVLMHLDK